MESWTMTRDGDGLRTGESGVRKGESDRVSGTNVGSSGRLDCRRAREKREKRANFRGNKATMWFRMSHLIQKWPKNKANLAAGFAEAGEHVQSEAGGTPALPD